MLRFASSKVNIDRYLLDYEYSKEPNREWLCSIINSLIAEEFQEFIQIMINNGKHELIESQNLGEKQNLNLLISLEDPKLFLQ